MRERGADRVGKPGESGFRLNGRRQNRNEAGMAEQGAVSLVGV